MTDFWQKIPKDVDRRCQNTVGPGTMSVAVLPRCTRRARWLYNNQHAVCTYHKNNNYHIGEWDGETGTTMWIAKRYDRPDSGTNLGSNLGSSADEGPKTPS